MTPTYLPEARLEVLHIVEWYFKQEKTLAAKFDAELRRAERDIMEFPEFWHPVSGGYRRYHLKRFPYSVFYRIKDEQVVIVAVAGQKEPEGYWRDR